MMQNYIKEGHFLKKIHFNFKIKHHYGLWDLSQSQNLRDDIMKYNNKTNSVAYFKCM